MATTMLCYEDCIYLKITDESSIKTLNWYRDEG